MNRYEHERQKVESDCGDVDPIDVVAKVQKHWPNVCVHSCFMNMETIFAPLGTEVHPKCSNMERTFPDTAGI